MTNITGAIAGARPASLAIVIVTWECGEELLRCARSLAGERRAAGGAPVELIVVDNASSDFDEDALRVVWPDVSVIRNSQNRGFGPAANQGVAHTRAEVVLLLNPDTVACHNALAEVLRAFAERPDAVAVAPRLEDAGGGAEEPQERFQLRRLPTWDQAVRELLLVDKVFPASPALLRERYLDADRSRPFPVEQPAAAALAVRQAAFEAVGGFDEAFFPAWFEDVDLCARLRRLGVVLFWPSAVFRHMGGVSAGRLGYDTFLPIYYRNACRYWRKHHGAAAALVYRWLLLTGMIMRLAALPFRRTVPRAHRVAARAYAKTALVALGLTPRAAALAP